MLLATVLIGAIMANHDKAVKYQATVSKQVRTLQQEVNTHQTQEIDTLKKQTQDQQKQIEDLKNQVQAKATQKAQNAVLASAVHTVGSFVAPNAYAASQDVASGVGDADKLFIYMHESGNRPGAINASSGACGLGQALPCSKMGCNLVDYACQDNFFTNYMLARYGSWANAAAFWRNHSWW